jgi:hypothetical protein
MLSNVAVQQDPAGNNKPDKEKSGEKIDGIVAGIMALARASRSIKPPNQDSRSSDASLGANLQECRARPERSRARVLATPAPPKPAFARVRNDLQGVASSDLEGMRQIFGDCRPSPARP